ncbi:transcription factor TFIIIC subunit tfc4, partial [Coemansia biformis]
LRLLRHEHAQAIVDIKRGARFVQGRGREHQWEGRELLDETDAEYGDSTLPIELRVKLGQCRLMLGQRDAAQQHIDPLLSQDVVAYEDLFMDVADTYAEAGHGARAVEIYQMLAACAETNQPPVWERLAKCYRDLGDLQSARRYATAVVEADSEDADMRLWLGEVYEEMGQTDLAYQMISVVEDMQSASHARVASDELAQQMVRSRIDDGHAEARGGGDVGGDASLVQLAERKPSEHAQRRRRDVEDERQRSLTAMRVAEVAFKKLDILRPQIEHSRGAVREYCAVARRLLADWRRIRAFYMANRGRPFQTYRNIVITNLERDAQSGELGPLAEASGQAAMRRQLDRMKRRLARQQRPQDDDDGAGGRPTTFRGHPFERWFDMFLAYAKCLALDKRPYEALEVLDVVCKSSVFFHSRVQHRTLSLMMLAVALNAGAGDRLYELLRGWCGPHPSRAARYKLFAFVMATSASAASMLTSANVYKFIRRQLDHLDSLYYHTHGTHEPLARDQPPMQPVGEGGIDDGLGLAEAVNGLVKSDLAALHSLAAHVMLVSRTGVAPLAQYTMALALVPQDASTALHLGVAYLVHSTKRDVGSAQAMVLRGLTYIERYAELRCMHQLRAAGRPASSRADVVVTQEIAYNFARAFHFVGLLDLAATYYHRVFVLPVSLVDAGGDGAARARCDLRSDAAYNLASIYTASGSPLRARALLAAHCTID